MIGLDKDMQGYAPASGKRGRQHVFSDAAIQFCLSIKGLFRLALRQTPGRGGDMPRLHGGRRLASGRGRRVSRRLH